MALDFHERETLLPSQFLIDAVILSENQKNMNRNGSSASTESVLNGFGSHGSSSSSSGLSTPLGSELGSTETESDEDDFVAELTRQMADYMLREDDENTAPNCVSAKPKCSDCNLGSKHHHDQRVISTPRKPSSAKNPDVGLYSNQAFTDDQMRAIRFYQLKNQQLVKHQGTVCWGRRGKTTESTRQHQYRNQQIYTEENRGRARGFGNSGRVRPTPPQVAGSGMRAIFLGGSGSRSGSCGTGVFLPRGTGNPQEPRRKKGCSTVLLPARVVQALQLHFHDINALSPSNSCDALTAYHLQPPDDVVMARSKDMQPEPKRHSQSRMWSAVNHHEMGLPQEWTY